MTNKRIRPRLLIVAAVLAGLGTLLYLAWPGHDMSSSSRPVDAPRPDESVFEHFVELDHIQTESQATSPASQSQESIQHVPGVEDLQLQFRWRTTLAPVVGAHVLLTSAGEAAPPLFEVVDSADGSATAAPTSDVDGRVHFSSDQLPSGALNLQAILGGQLIVTQQIPESRLDTPMHGTLVIDVPERCVRGRVIDEHSKQPIESVGVSIRVGDLASLDDLSARTQVVYSQTTGAFQAYYPCEVDAVIRFDRPGYESRWISLAKVCERDELALGDIELADTRDVTVSVRGHENRPQAGAQLRALYTKHPSIQLSQDTPEVDLVLSDTIRTDERGLAKLQLRSEEPQASFDVLTEDGAHYRLTNISVDWRNRIVNLDLEEPGQVMGVVSDRSGLPIPRCEVGLFRGSEATHDDPAAEAMSETTADESGNFAFERIQPGAYCVKVNAAGRTLHKRHEIASACAGVAQRVKVGAGNAVAVQLVADCGQFVSGHVVDDTGVEADSEILIVATSGATRDAIEAAATKGGQFVIGPLPTGPVQIRAEVMGNDGVSGVAVADAMAGATDVQLNIGRLVVVRGTITDDSGNLVSAVLSIAPIERASHERSWRIDAAGHYEVRVPVGAAVRLFAATESACGETQASARGESPVNTANIVVHKGCVLSLRNMSMSADCGFEIQMNGMLIIEDNMEPRGDRTIQLPPSRPFTIRYRFGQSGAVREQTGIAGSESSSQVISLE